MNNGKRPCPSEEVLLISLDLKVAPYRGTLARRFNSLTNFFFSIRGGTKRASTKAPSLRLRRRGISSPRLPSFLPSFRSSRPGCSWKEMGREGTAKLVLIF